MTTSLYAIVKDAYRNYRLGKPTGMSDLEFDELEKSLLASMPYALENINKELAEDLYRQAIKLPTPMEGIAQIDDSKQIQSWLAARKTATLNLSAKMDGMALQLVYRDGTLISAFSKYSGDTGFDMMKHVFYMPTVPKQIQTGDLVVKGEVIVKKSIFKQKYSDDFKNPRNMVSGVMNRKLPAPEVVSDFDFVAYWSSGSLGLSQRLSALKSLGFQTVEWQSCLGSDVSESSLTHLLDHYRVSDYEIDGVVVAHNADLEDIWKFKIPYDGNFAETTVKFVEWRVHKTGTLRPRIHLEDTPLMGVTVSHVSGLNAFYIKHGRLFDGTENQEEPSKPIGPGARVKIVRAGDVVPYIEDILEPAAEADLPSLEEYPDQQWAGPHLVVSESGAEEIAFRKMLYFFRTLNVKGIADASLRKLFAEGFDTIPKLYAAKIDQYPDFGPTNTQKLYDLIHGAIKDVELHKLAAASSCFRDCAIERMLTVAEAYDGSLLSWKDHCDNTIRSNLTPIIGPEMAKRIVNGIPSWLDFFLDLSDATNDGIVLLPFAQKGDQLAGKSFVFTGFRAPEWEDSLKKAGAKVTGSVSKNTTAVVVASLSGSSSKLEKAKILEVPLIVKDSFEEYLNDSFGYRI